MTKPILSYPKASAVSTGIFFLGLAANAYYDAWWPYIMLTIGLSLALRQFLVKKFYDAFISLLIFIGIFITVHFNLTLLPVIFIIAGLYILFKAMQNEPETIEDEDDETQKELEERKK